MPLFSRKSKPTKSQEGVLTEEDEILGYLDELFRKRISLSVNVGKEHEDCSIFFIDEKKKLLRIQGDFRAKIANGTPLQAGFSLDRTWFIFKSKFAIVDGKLHVLIPEAIKHHERRKCPRTSFNPREVVKVTVLEGLGTGNGVFGTASDISASGLCLNIERAMRLKDETEIQPSPGLFPPGTSLMMVKINRVPGCTLMEVQGTACRVFRDGRWKLALSFRKLSSAHEGAIKKFVDSRTLDFKLVRRSKKKRDEMDAAREESSPDLLGVSDSPIDVKPVAKPEPKPEPPLPAKPEPTPAPTPRPVESAVQSPAQSTAAAIAAKIKILTLGEEITDRLGQPVVQSFHFFTAATPVSTVKILKEEDPPFLLCGEMFKNRSVIEFIEQISPMGVLKNVTVVFYGTSLPPKDLIKLKMLELKDFVTIAEEDPAALIKALSAHVV